MVQKIQTTAKTPSEFGSRWSDVPKIKSKFQYLLDQKIEETEDDKVDCSVGDSCGSDSLGICDHVGFTNSLNDLNRTIARVNKERM